MADWFIATEGVKVVKDSGTNGRCGSDASFYAKA